VRAAVNIDPNPNKVLGKGIQTSGNAVLAYAGPDGIPTDSANVPPPDRISVYEVKKNDTLSDIAHMYGVSVNTIIWANNLSGPRDVHLGDILIILPVSGVEYKVVLGDTLKSIAKKYNADANEIAQYNGLDTAVPPKVGSTIIIPGGELSTPAPVTSGSTGSVIKEPLHGAGGSALAGYFSNPVPGARINQGLHGWNAVDLGGAGISGTPIHAAADGTVIIARNNGGWNGGYGNYVVITHPNGTQTLYAHMKSAIVSPGQSVFSTQVIGYVGSTGESTGAHLHFEVRGAENPFRNCSVSSVCSPQ
jgi:murein DD-endopeptidase MepM/ murein hydrolase activator NlpD